MEATGLTGEYEIVAMVSIHASVMEATQAMYVNGPVPVVSIHASVMEATHHDSEHVRAALVSIHASVMEATIARMRAEQVDEFRSTPP